MFVYDWSILSFKPYNYLKTTGEGIINQIKHTFKNAENFKKSITNILDSLAFTKEIKEQLNNMEDSYKYVSAAVIVIIIIFIILNMFTNVNRQFLLFIRNIIYNNYEGKYNDLRKKFDTFKLTKIIKESDEMKGITKNYDTIKRIKKEEEPKKDSQENNNSLFLNRIDEIKNLGFNQLKSFT